MMWQVLSAAFIGSCLAQEYSAHDQIPVTVNNVGPFNNPAESYRFYSLPYCAPKQEQDHSHNLGEVLAGDRQRMSLYDMRFKVDVQWQALCRFRLQEDEVSHFIKGIREHYVFEMMVDDLPVKGFVGEIETINTMNDHGHVTDSSRVYLFTHLDFSIAFNEGNVIACNLTTDPEQRIELVPGKSQEVEFSFGVTWHASETQYHDRDQMHSKSIIDDQSVEIHWLSIFNSFVLVVLLTAFLSVIFMRVLKKDFARYMDLDEEDFDDSEEIGWKLVHGDVFRFPEHPMVLCAAVGTGCQLLILMTAVLFLALLGNFMPGHRGALYSAAVFLYALTAGFAGYVSTYMYVQMGGEKWASNAVMTACIFAVPFFANFCVLNTMAVIWGSQAAMPFGTICIVILLWALVTFPLTVMGSMRARKPLPYDAPCKTNRAAREIPPQHWLRKPMVLIFSGFLPFSAIYIELHYILASIWGHRAYTLFEILCLAFIMLLMVTAAISTALTYFQLAGEDYHWWWRSFFSGASTGVFMFGYATFYYNNRSEMSGMLQCFYFFGYIALVCYGFALMLGAVSFLTAQKFVKHIYSSIKVD